MSSWRTENPGENDLAGVGLLCGCDELTGYGARAWFAQVGDAGGDEQLAAAAWKEAGFPLSGSIPVADLEPVRRKLRGEQPGAVDELGAAQPFWRLQSLKLQDLNARQTMGWWPETSPPWGAPRRSVSSEDFKSLTPSAAALADPGRFTRSDSEDIAKMERLLDLQEGVLAREVRDFHLERIVCEECGRLLTTYDFVFTALVDAGHSKGLIVQTMLGNKLVLNVSREIRCSNCSRINARGDYTMPNYACCPAEELQKIKNQETKSVPTPPSVSSV
ncbi:hypothetical protein ACPCTG_32715 [Streptomyces pseudogriseolus]|uniref:hypothetical protein n=1 Tax=Streptomyces pseudogriseolus TaxID=36817 RepID=UPI003FA2D5F0